MKIRILLLEDDALAARALVRLISRLFPTVSIDHRDVYPADDSAIHWADIVVSDGRYPSARGGPPEHQIARVVSDCERIGTTLVAYVGEAGDVDADSRAKLGDRLLEKPDVPGLTLTLKRLIASRAVR